MPRTRTAPSFEGTFENAVTGLRDGDRRQGLRPLSGCTRFRTPPLGGANKKVIKN